LLNLKRLAQSVATEKSEASFFYYCYFYYYYFVIIIIREVTQIT